MSNRETEQLVAQVFHSFRAAAKAEKRGRDKGSQRIMEALLRRERGETPGNRFSDVPFPEHMREKP